MPLKIMDASDAFRRSLMMESLQDFVKRRRPTCDRCGRDRNGDQRVCECISGRPPMLVRPSNEHLLSEYQDMVAHNVNEQPK